MSASISGFSRITSFNLRVPRVGLVSYFCLTLICRRVFHNPEAEFLLATQVPSQLYDRSTFIFLTALALDLLNVFFERNTVKLELVLLPAFIKVGVCMGKLCWSSGNNIGMSSCFLQALFKLVHNATHQATAVGSIHVC